MAVPVGMPDHALLTRARDGDGEAFEALYRRHHRAATRAAHSYSSRSQLAEDAVQEAFMRILHATKEGGGPKTEFRAYLATTVRHVIAGWTRGERTVASDDLEVLAGEDVRDTSRPESRLHWHLLTKAFKSLPTRWQEALWLGEVEGVAPAELASRWNMSANSAAALLYRAREGLRTAWLDAHVNEGLVPDACRPYVTDLSRYTQGKLTDRRELQVREHLDDCEYCRAVLFEVDTAASELRVLLLPVALWGGLALAGAGLTLGPLATLGKTLSGLSSRGLAVGAVGATAVAAVVVAAMNPGLADPGPDVAGGRPLVSVTDSSGDQGGSGSDDDGATIEPTSDEDASADPEPTDEPEPTETVDATDAPTESPTTTPLPNPSSDEDPTTSPTTSVPVIPPIVLPDDPTTSPEQPTEPEDPSDSPEDPDDTPEEPDDTPDAPTVEHRVTDGAIELYGTGEPGATVAVETAGSGTSAATSGAGATGRSVQRGPLVLAGSEVATTTVADDGTWQVTPDLDAVAGLTVVAVQTVDGHESARSGRITLPARPGAPEIAGMAYGGSDVSMFGGDVTPGATVLVIAADGMPFAVVQADAEGGWSTSFPLTAEIAETEVFAVQLGANGLRSARSSGVPLPQYLEPEEPEEPSTQVEPPGYWGSFHLTLGFLNWMTLLGDGEPGAQLIMRTEDGTQIGQSRVDADWGTWSLGFWDSRISAGGLTVYLSQVVDGVESPQTGPILLTTSSSSNPDPAPSDEAVGEDSASEESVTQQPEAPEPADEATSESSSTAEPATSEPTDEPVTDEPAVEQPASEEPAADQPTSEEPTTEEPLPDESATEDAVVEDSVVDDPVIEEPAAEEPTAVEQPAGEEPAAS